MLLIDDIPAALLDENNEPLLDEFGDEEYSLVQAQAYVAGAEATDDYASGPAISAAFLAGSELTQMVIG